MSCNITQDNTGGQSGAIVNYAKLNIPDHTNVTNNVSLVGPSVDLSNNTFAGGSYVIDDKSIVGVIVEF